MDKKRNLTIASQTLEEAIVISQDVLTSLEGKEYVFPIQQATFYDFVVRSHCCLSSVNLMWKSFAQKALYKFPIAIQLRVGVLDFLTFTYLFKFRDNSDDFNSEVDRLNQSFYSWISKHIDETDLTKKQEIDELLRLHFPLKYDSLGDSKKVKSQVISDMAKDAITGELGEYVSATYNIYRLLSQYEHYSDVSRKFMLRPTELDLEQFLVAIDCVLLLQYFCFQLLGVDPILLGRHDTLYNKYVSGLGAYKM